MYAHSYQWYFWCLISFFFCFTCRTHISRYFKITKSFCRLNMILIIVRSLHCSHAWEWLWKVAYQQSKTIYIRRRAQQWQFVWAIFSFRFQLPMNSKKYKTFQHLLKKDFNSIKPVLLPCFEIGNKYSW